MDIDAFVAAHQGAWFRLQQLTERARRVRDVSPDELDELIHLYQRVGANLATARVEYAADTAVVNRLTLLVADAHGVLYGQRDVEVGRGLRHFVGVTFPEAIWHIRRYIVAAALFMLVPWAAMQIWISVSPQAYEASGPEAATQQYVNQDFEDYYSNQPSQNFATQVFLNNVRVAFLAFAAGALLCVFTIALLVWNGANVGVAGGLFTHVGLGDKFWGLILPHGMLEISAVIVAGAAGLKLGWTVIDPGDRPRLHAFVEESRKAGSVLVGLVVAFLLAATVEGFVTGRPWSTAVRVGIGVFVFCAFWGWTVFAIWRLRHTAPPEPSGGLLDDDQSRPVALSSR